jgi:CHAD domain-containing protein
MNDKPAMFPQRPVGDALRAAAHDMLRDAQAPLDNPKLTDAVAIHDFRRAMKRWRALLRLLEPIVGEDARRLRLAARDMARALAGPRDAQSALDALDDATNDKSSSKSHDKSSAAHVLPPHTVTAIRNRLEGIRNKTEAATLTEPRRTALRAALTSADDAFDRWPLDAVTFDDVAAQLAVSYRRARRRIPSDWSKTESEALHQLRQRVIAHRYQMELVEPLWPRLCRLWIGEAQRLRNRLGAYQDLNLLARLSAPHQPLARWHTQLAPIIVDRQSAHKHAAARLSARMFVDSPKTFRQRLIALWNADHSG